MIKQAILFASLLFIGIGASAQDDPKSKAILDNLMTKAKAWTSYEAEFTSQLQNTKDKLDVKQVGSMKVKGKKFRLVMDKNTIINDGTTMYTYNKDANEVNLTDPADMDQELDPTKLFTQYETGFKSQFVEEKAVGGVTVQVVKLFPLDAGKKPFHTVVITIDKTKAEPKSVQILYKDGNAVTYTCLLYTSDAADERSSVDLGGRRIIKKKKTYHDDDHIMTGKHHTKNK